MRAIIAVLGLLITVAFGRVSAGAYAQGSAPASRDLSLTFVGDIMGHDVNYRMQDYHDIYRGVQDLLRSSDLTFANLELSLDPFRPAAGYPLFNGTRAYLAAAVDSGINLFSLANNHAFDGGVEGILQTTRALEEARLASLRPFAYSGIRANPARPFSPAPLTVKGVRVGFLAVSQFLNERDGGRYVQVVDYSRPDETEPFLAWVRSIAPLYDLLIVSYHGDREYVQTPSPSKRRFFRALLGAGAAIVVGHHPHVVQEYEIVDSGGVRRLAMYSMGNFISGMTWTVAPSRLDGMLAATGESYLLRVEVRCGSDGCSVTDARPIPIANYMDGRMQMVVARLSDLADGSVSLSPPWRAYYSARLALMRQFLGMK
jgi:poly-gamma-glutamate capsule biosynthesis protein CapA/YwtB (metallophosphatase superfamily)